MIEKDFFIEVNNIKFIISQTNHSYIISRSIFYKSPQLFFYFNEIIENDPPIYLDKKYLAEFYEYRKDYLAAIEKYKTLLSLI